MKKLSFLFVALLSFGSVHSQTLVDGLYYNLIPDFDGEGTVAQVVKTPDGTTYRGDIIIPSSVVIEGIEYPVTSIDCAYDMYPSSIYIPKTIKYIVGSGGYSFFGHSLKNIVISTKDTRFYDKDDGTVHELNALSLGLDYILDETISLTLLMLWRSSICIRSLEFP